jgi:uncharacterized repeat protein (TIGR03803 family)
MTVLWRALPTGGTLLAAFLILIAHLAAQTNQPLKTVHMFSGGANDGAGPAGGVALGPGAVLYGVTTYGGTGPCTDSTFGPGCGTVYSLTPPASTGGDWSEAVLYSFPSQARAETGLAVGEDGALYGTTDLGGTSDQGSVFALIPPESPGGAWTETTLCSFAESGGVGNGPSVAVGNGGVLYGTTSVGGTSNQGMVFSLTPPSSPGEPWTETVLHNFTGFPHDGARPRGVVIGAGGVLYGTTRGGGEFTKGAVFLLIPPATPGGPWSERTIYSFGAATDDGGVPLAGLAIGPGEVLYGTTEQGGTFSEGTVFSLTPPADPGGPWSEAVLYSFTGAGNDGLGPTAPVVIGRGGVLYGTTAESAAPEDPGTVYSLTPPAVSGGPWTETVLYSFPTGPSGAPDGRNPTGGLAIGPNDALFGATEQGGSGYRGTVFLLRP